MKKYIYKN